MQLHTKDWLAIKSEAAKVAAVAAVAKSLTFGLAKQASHKANVRARLLAAMPDQSFQFASAEQLHLALIEMETHLLYFIENNKWK